MLAKSLENPEKRSSFLKRMEWLVWVTLLLAAFHATALVVAYCRLGGASLGLWDLSTGLFAPVAGFLLVFSIAWSLWKRPFFRPIRMLSFVGLAAVYFTPNILRTYPSSHDGKPSKVRFRLPLDGPVTVGWGGATEDVNYHVYSPDQRWAYDLFIQKDNKPYKGDGSRLSDYYCYGQPVHAPADGDVRRVDDGHSESPPGQMGGSPAGGNQVVIEVASKEFLFLCHMNPHSIRVKPGQRVRQGDVIGLCGNSGNTSMPHVHVHLQDTPEDDWGEGIPLEFYRYHSGGRLVERGIPRGGPHPEEVENEVETRPETYPEGK
jgi:hypothetical protein